MDCGCSPLLHLPYRVSVLTFLSAASRIAGLATRPLEGVARSVFITRRFFALVSTPLLALEAAAFIDGAVRKVAVSKVAVLSVTGPADWQETINAAEAGLVGALRAKGLAVVSLADSKSFTSANWQAAYSNVQVGKPTLARNGNTGQRASRNTVLLADPGQSAGQRGYSPTYCRTAGELSRQMGADAAVVLTISAGRVVQVLMIDQAGAYLFREQVQWDSKNAVTAAISQALGRYPN